MTTCPNPDRTCQGRILHDAGTEFERSERCPIHDPVLASDFSQLELYALAAATSGIRKGDKIRPVAGRKLRDCRAESDPFIGKLPGDQDEGLLINWSHQASDNERHWCTGKVSSFSKEA